MSRKIFWSWQSDTALTANRDLVRKALSIAIEDLNEELEIEDAYRLDIDEAIKDKPGAPGIARTILDKISRAAVFVADLTPVADLTLHTDEDKKKRKAFPNSNVLIELGYALSEIREERIIMILNEASGYTPEDLPFDIRDRRVRIYKCKESSHKKTKKKEAEKLSKKLKKDLELCLDLPAASKPAASVPAVSEPKIPSIKAIGINIEEEIRVIIGPEIRIANAMEGDPSIWETAAYPVSYQSTYYDGEKKKISFPHGVPRGYLRIIPTAGWKNGISPKVEDIEELVLSSRVQAVGSDDYGHCDEGFVDLCFREGNESEKLPYENAAMWFKETGEYWIIHGSVIGYHLGSYREEGPLCLDLENLKDSWEKALRAGMNALDSLGAFPERRVEAGVVRIKRVLLRREIEGKCFDDKISTRHQWANWDDKAISTFLDEAYNKIRARYDPPPVSLKTDDRMEDDIPF